MASWHPHTTEARNRAGRIPAHAYLLVWFLAVALAAILGGGRQNTPEGAKWAPHPVTVTAHNWRVGQ